MIKKVDRATGQEVVSWGNSKFAVWVTDADQGLPQSTGTDTIAISFSNPTGSNPIINRIIETSTHNQIALGGGNIVIRKK